MQVEKKRFLVSAGVILAIVGGAKVCSALGNAKMLALTDPIIGFQFRYLMFTAGIIELVVATFCFFRENQWMATILVAWLSTNLLVYRIGLWSMGWHRPCSCLGSLTEVIHVSPQLADNIMKGVLAYLLIGSYANLLGFWRQKRQVVSASVPSGPSAPSSVP